MKRLLLLAAVPALLMLGCYPTTKITATWRNGREEGKNYASVYVAALTGNTIARSTLEKDIEAALKGYGIQVIKSFDEFPPTFKKDSLSRAEIMSSVRKNKSQAILTISVLRKETESRYMGGTYAPMRWGYYGTFWGYYNYWYPYAYSDGYYTNDYVYYLETNLYDASTESLVWSAQSKTWSYDDLTGFSKEFSKLIADQMRKEGVIKTEMISKH
jgi:hypothetical protein